MSIQIGEAIPEATLMVMGDAGPQPVKTGDLFSGKRSLLFAVPGAFTPTCSAQHLPGYVEHAQAFDEKGVDQVICTSVNDIFVMDAWGKTQGKHNIIMAADGNGELAMQLGLSFDGSNFGMGIRSQRYAMLVEDAHIAKLFVEQPGAFDVSSADHLLTQI